MSPLTFDEILLRNKQEHIVPLELCGVKRWDCGRQTRLIRCKCICGKTIEMSIEHFLKRTNTSCGCLRIKKIIERNTKYEGNVLLINKLYIGIRTRCYDEKHPTYKYYGAKGVKMCDEWLNDYPKFLKWCLENGWEEGLEIDKDIKSPTKPGKLYCPEMCCFVTGKKNKEYRSNTIRMEYNGAMLLLTDIADRVGIPYKMLYHRLFLGKGNPSGKTLQEAIDMGDKNEVLHEFGGEKLTLNGICKKIGMNRATFWWRVGAGWSISDIISTVPSKGNHIMNKKQANYAV